MRSKLGRFATAGVAGMMLVASVTSGAEAGSEPETTESTTTTSEVQPEPEPDTTESTTTTTSPEPEPEPEPEPVTATTSSTTTTSTTTTSSPPPPLIGELSVAAGRATPSRGTAAQVTETIPPPPTTTTTTQPPSWVLPADSGTGRRVVYSKSRMRVWTVEADGRVSKTHLVSGRRTWNQPTPGTYSVFSRSRYTCNINNPHICWRYMVRFTKGPDGDNIGFHEIPTDTKTGYKLQSVSQLGQALSGGCVRQSTPDAQYMWDWAPIGTKVVVLG